MVSSTKDDEEKDSIQTIALALIKQTKAVLHREYTMLQCARVYTQDNELKYRQVSINLS